MKPRRASKRSSAAARSTPRRTRKRTHLRRGLVGVGFDGEEILRSACADSAGKSWPDFSAACSRKRSAISPAVRPPTVEMPAIGRRSSTSARAPWRSTPSSAASTPVWSCASRCCRRAKIASSVLSWAWPRMIRRRHCGDRSSASSSARNRPASPMRTARLPSAQPRRRHRAPCRKFRHPRPRGRCGRNFRAPPAGIRSVRRCG